MTWRLFFGRLASFFGKNRAERARKKGLKQVAKGIAANRYRDFFRVKSAQAAPELAQFFYSIYKVVAQAEEVLQNAGQSRQLKMRVVSHFMDQWQREILEELTAESVQQRAEEAEADFLFRRMQTEFADLERGFDRERVHNVNECYQLIMMVCQFAVHDYGFFLRKFEPRLSERSATGELEFGSLRGEAIVEDLKDFLELAGGMDPYLDWSAPLSLLDEFAGREVFDPKEWKAMLHRTWEALNSGIFELMIRFIEKDPAWIWKKAKVKRENIVAPCLELIRDEIFDNLSLAVTAKWNTLIEMQARALFGRTRVSRLRHYTEEEGDIYKKKDLPGFTEARALNYLTAFVNDTRPEMQDFYDLVLIRGHWASTAQSFPLSEALWLLAGFPARIAKLDDMFSDWGLYGAKLKPAIARIDRDESVAWMLTRRLNAGNKEARQIVTDAMFHLTVLSDGIKELVEDCRRNPGIIILNWSELSFFSETTLKNQIAELWIKMRDMLELLRMLVQEQAVVGR